MLVIHTNEALTCAPLQMTSSLSRLDEIAICILVLLKKNLLAARDILTILPNNIF